MSVYSTEIAEKICQRISEGESLRLICKNKEMPSKASVFRWLKDPESSLFRDQYARARASQVEHFLDEIIEIADDSFLDVTLDENGKASGRKDNIQRAKLRIDTRKWIMAKQRPRKYGEV